MNELYGQGNYEVSGNLKDYIICVTTHSDIPWKQTALQDILEKIVPLNMEFSAENKLSRHTIINIFAGTAHETYYKPSAIIGGYNEKRTTHQKLFAGISPFLDYKPAIITDGYAEQRISGQKFFTGTSQILNYKPAAVAEGYQTTRIINQNLHMKAIAIAQYKPSAVIADAAN